MNVAFVVHDYDVREGHGRYAVELVTRLAQSIDVTLYAANVRDQPPDGVRTVRVAAVRRPSYATIFSFPRAFASVRGRHDLVHAQGWSAPSADVVTAHIVLAAWRAAADRAGMQKGLGERLLGGVVARREAAFYQTGARWVIAPSTRVKADLSKYYRRDDRVSVIPHALSGKPIEGNREADRVALEIGRDAFVALYAGDARKGLLVAIEAVAANPGVELLVVSRSPAGPYVGRAKQLGIENRIHWIGSLPDVTPAHVAADVLIHPTIYDAFGLVVAESMACGTPPIVANTAGVTDHIEHKVSGWILARGDVAECSEALTALRNDDALRHRIGANARAVAAGRTWDDVTRETLACYERALTKS